LKTDAFAVGQRQPSRISGAKKTVAMVNQVKNLFKQSCRTPKSQYENAHAQVYPSHLISGFLYSDSP